mmetsp:Transcript_4121/g.4773  ORF Transcript_4121/g.4773 Transcript_4121/m.4773 type:complete len:298 (-) Transcript_4121:59-952(-)
MLSFRTKIRQSHFVRQFFDSFGFNNNLDLGKIRSRGFTTSLKMSGCEDGVCRRVSSTKSSADESTVTDSQPGVEFKDAGNGLKLKINIISDTMCPWCYVGKKNLEEALKSCEDVEAEINWLPYFLDKDLPDEGKPVEDYYRDNYGDKDAGNRMKPHLIAAGNKVGIDFEKSYANMTHYRPTIQSHRLIEFAKRNGKQNEMVEELFQMYYLQGKHLNNTEHLVQAAEKINLIGAKEYLQSDEDTLQIFRRADRVKQSANGVPTFIIFRPDRPSLQPIKFSGGQPPQTFIKSFDFLRSQ